MDGFWFHPIHYKEAASAEQIPSLILMGHVLVSQGIVHLATTYYKLLPMHASDLFIDLAYFHLDLSAIAVKGMLPHLLELSGDNAVKLALKEREMKDEKVAAAVETALRLVICQRNSLPLQNGKCIKPYSVKCGCLAVEVGLHIWHV